MDFDHERNGLGNDKLILWVTHYTLYSRKITCQNALLNSTTVCTVDYSKLTQSYERKLTISKTRLSTKCSAHTILQFLSVLGMSCNYP